MQDQYAKHLYQLGMIALRDNDLQDARRYFERASYAAQDFMLLADIYYGWYEAVTDHTERRKKIDQALANNMMHAKARRALAIMNGRIKEEEIINPDDLPELPKGEVAVEARRFMCPKCGGRKKFAPNGHSLVCEYCTRSETISNQSRDEAKEQDFFSALATIRGHSKPVSQKIFHCDGCGAEFILLPGTISSSCSYCDSPHVVQLEKTRDLLNPDGIIPHAFRRKQATEFLVKWVEARNFVPDGKVQLPHGFYLPIWTFDVGGGISYSGRVEIEEYRILYAKQPQFRDVQDMYTVHIDDMLIPATKKNRHIVERLMTSYQLQGVQPYDPRFLVDWPAEVYDMSLADASLEARRIAYAQYRELLPTRLPGVRDLKMSSAELAIDSYKLLLVPVWLVNYRYQEREYHVMINGQTGIIYGENHDDEKRGLMGWLNSLMDL